MLYNPIPLISPFEITHDLIPRYERKGWFQNSRCLKCILYTMSTSNNIYTLYIVIEKNQPPHIDIFTINRSHGDPIQSLSASVRNYSDVFS